MQVKTLQLEGRQAGRPGTLVHRTSTMHWNCRPVTKHIKCCRWIWIINITDNSPDWNWCFVLMLNLVLIYFFPEIVDWTFTFSVQFSLVYLSYTLSFTTSGWSQHVWCSSGTSKVRFKKLLHMFYDYFQKIRSDRFWFLNDMPYLQTEHLNHNQICLP